jgi:hypothetical protein
VAADNNSPDNRRRRYETAEGSRINQPGEAGGGDYIPGERGGQFATQSAFRPAAPAEGDPSRTITRVEPTPRERRYPNAEPEIAHGNEPAQNRGQISGQISGQIPATASAGCEIQEIAHEIPTKNAREIIRGQITEKSVGKSGNAHGFSAARTEWFRYEMDFRERKKGGYQVLIRRRLKWSASRYAPTIASCLCVDLTKRMVESMKDGKFTNAAIVSLQNGGISHEIIKNLLERIGKGNGKRATELTEHERSILARIESGLAASGGRRNASAGGMGRRMDFPRADVPNPHDGEFTEVPNVH